MENPYGQWELRNNVKIRFWFSHGFLFDPQLKLDERNLQLQVRRDYRISLSARPQKAIPWRLD